MSLSKPIQHIAIIMDGNGRWALAQGKMRHVGHKAGFEAAKRIILAALKSNVPYLTLFAFGQDNWRRPSSEVSYLFALFERVLVSELNAPSFDSVAVRVVGDVAGLPERLQGLIKRACLSNPKTPALTVNLAINYSGQWDVQQAVQKTVKAQLHSTTADTSAPELINQSFESFLSFAGQPEPELLIRTSGVSRLSNFMLYDLAYAELYFTDKLWPDFNESDFQRAIAFYLNQERRFGGLTPANLVTELSPEAITS